MSGPQIHGRRASFSASKAVDELGADLEKIKKADGLTWADVGRVLGKSDDQAAKYASGLAEMSITSFLLACREWNGRIGNGVLGMIGHKLVPVDAEDVSDSDKLCRILRLASLLADAMTDHISPGTVDTDELKSIGALALDDAARAIDALRIRLAAINAAESEGLRIVSG
ncbi:MAG TPA: hypothetical protein VF503_08985 [Sphingobium sp.]|uniref:hypothetical protein n=1 Tax=Sphingobium sp. TaxID=1912891 RepID=UPI002ED25FA0